MARKSHKPVRQHHEYGRLYRVSLLSFCDLLACYPIYIDTDKTCQKGKADSPTLGEVHGTEGSSSVIPLFYPRD